MKKGLVLPFCVFFSLSSGQKNTKISNQKLPKKQLEKNETLKELPVKKKESEKKELILYNAKNNKGLDHVITNTRSITLNTDINEKTITYDRHWYKPYPSDFKITIDGKEYMSLKNGKPTLHEKVFNIAKNKVKVTYEWALHKFGKLWHTEKKEMEFELPPDKKELIMKFSWDNDNRISIENAKMVLCASSSSTQQAS